MSCPFLDAIGPGDANAEKAAASVMRQWDWSGYPSDVKQRMLAAAGVLAGTHMAAAFNPINPTGDPSPQG